MVMTNSTFSRAAKELAEKLDVQLMEGCPSNDILGTMYKILRLINISILILEAFILCGSFLFHYPELTLPGYFLLRITFLAAVSSFPGWHRLFFNLCSCLLYLLVFMILIIPGIFYGNLDYRLLLSTLPAIFSFAHVLETWTVPMRNGPLNAKKNAKSPDLDVCMQMHCQQISNLLLLSVTVRKQRRDICLNMTAAVLIHSSYIVQNFI